MAVIKGNGQARRAGVPGGDEQAQLDGVGVATDHSGNVYVLNYGGTTLDQIQKFACP